MATIPTNDVHASLLAAEFKDGNYSNTSLSSLYRNTAGGSSPPWVPNQIPNAGDIATSGTTSYSNFRGKWNGWRQIFAVNYYNLGGGQTSFGWSVTPEIPMMMNFGEGNFAFPGLYTFWSYYNAGSIVATVLTIIGDYRVTGYQWWNHVEVSYSTPVWYGNGGYPLYRGASSNPQGNYVSDFKQSPPQYTYWTWPGVSYFTSAYTAPPYDGSGGGTQLQVYFDIKKNSP